MRLAFLPLPTARAACIALAAAVCPWAAANETPPERPASEPLAADLTPLARVALGIIDSTRWPGPPRSVELCLATVGSFGTEVAITVAGGPARPRPMTLRVVPANAAPPAECDALVFGGWDDALARAVLSALVTRPVLTIGMGAASCRQGALFCLLPSGPGSRFGANPELVQRSGLTVNPRVLQLARPRPRELPPQEPAR